MQLGITGPTSPNWGCRITLTMSQNPSRSQMVQVGTLRQPLSSGFCKWLDLADRSSKCWQHPHLSLSSGYWQPLVGFWDVADAIWCSQMGTAGLTVPRALHHQPVSFQLLPPIIIETKISLQHLSLPSPEKAFPQSPWRSPETLTISSSPSFSPRLPLLPYWQPPHQLQ